MEIIAQYSNSYEGNDCIIHKFATVTYIPGPEKYLVTEIEYYQGSWTSDDIETTTHIVSDEETAKREAQEFVED